MSEQSVQDLKSILTDARTKIDDKLRNIENGGTTLDSITLPEGDDAVNVACDGSCNC